jgi:hypothetical protein
MQATGTYDVADADSGRAATIATRMTHIVRFITYS